MKQKKFLSTLLACTLTFSMAAGYTALPVLAADETAAEATDETTNKTTEENSDTETVSTEQDESSEESASSEEDNQAAAGQLLTDLTGTYEELWPVILDDKYEDLWLDNCKELVGEENAQAAYEKLASMVSGEIYGEEAVKAYADGNGVYDCEFTEGVATLKFDGSTSTIKGYDENGEELFSHTYHYVGMEDIRGLPEKHQP